jgi:hypothetical protein
MHLVPSDVVLMRPLWCPIAVSSSGECFKSGDGDSMVLIYKV